eukprot:TRINITY_DN38479_c0_g1_i1.p1 TRINITY_DN38479_c0_g1~~TRINITY_DN38479_c0_g1_i1.p1  ORF type:complete len:101 (-),score=27.66 TRINITY_DN38479_c0_g1_i1:231-533(-)
MVPAMSQTLREDCGSSHEEGTTDAEEIWSSADEQGTSTDKSVEDGACEDDDDDDDEGWDDVLRKIKLLRAHRGEQAVNEYRAQVMRSTRSLAYAWNAQKN